MSRRSTSRTINVVTSTVKPKNDLTIDMSLLNEDGFNRRPKTDYTYSRSATYSSKYADGQVVSPNLSRRTLYTATGLTREHQAASSLLKTKSTSSHVRTYGKTRNVLATKQSNSDTNSDPMLDNSLHNGLQHGNASRSFTRSSADSRDRDSSAHNQTTTTQHTVHTSRNQHSQVQSTKSNISTTEQQQNNNNSEAIFSGDESDSIMSRSGTRSNRKTTRRPSRSPVHNRRLPSGSSRRRSARRQDDGDSESSTLDIVGRGSGGVKQSATYALSSGLDDDSGSSLQRLTHDNTRYNANELVTERSSTIIDTVATGSPIAAKFMGCILFVYGCACILVNRIWYNFGHPIYTTLQRYLLVDCWILSRELTRRLRGLVVGLLVLLIPLALLAASVCSLHALGAVNVSSCGPLTGIYYVSKHSDVNTPGMSAKLRSMLDDLFTWTESHKVVPLPVHAPTTSVVNWESVIDMRIAAMRSSLELQSNAEISAQRQKNTELETAVGSLTRDVDTLRQRFTSLTAVIKELSELRVQIAQLSELTSNQPDHRDAIAKLQRDIRSLQLKLGDVDLSQESGGDAGVLVFLFNELSNLKSTLREQVKTSLPAAVCPDSSCVCESDLGLRLRTLHEELMRELNEKSAGGTTVFVSSDNSSGISEQLVKKMIQDELDIFAADKTGMPDFALQSMGAQVVSTRCSRTYYQDAGIMTYFGLPLYHLHKDPAVVIQPGVTPGECWCFHGQSGALVIELAESVMFNSFSIEHISARQSVTGEILSAPKDIEVYGLKSELDTEGRRIGNWRYEKSGPRLQFFPVKEPAIPGYPVVELRVLSNWGKKEFTCLYRFRVHGKLAPK